MAPVRAALPADGALPVFKPPAVPEQGSKVLTLWVHESSSPLAQHDCVVNPEFLPNVAPGQVLRVYSSKGSQQQQMSTGSPAQTQQNKQQQQTQAQSERQPSLTEPVIVKVAAVDKTTKQLQISLHKDLADKLIWRSRMDVVVEPINSSMVALDHIELAFNDQYIGRSDMWRLQQSLRGTCVYSEKKILYAGLIKATVKRLFSGDSLVTSGYVDSSTRAIFRSGSAKFFLFIQMSKEMWDFDEDGELHFEKVVNNFLPDLFNRWSDNATNHVVSIVLFSRVFYNSTDCMDNDPGVNITEDGRIYKDFYKVIADWETTENWRSYIGPLKREQLAFQRDILLRKVGDKTVVCGEVSLAYEGNVLEAINLALNPFDRHYIDRDLLRSGLSIIMITPGAGKFFTSKKLLRLTNERMTDNGIAMDLVCLSKMPLHVTPLFVYKSSPPAARKPNETKKDGSPQAVTKQSKVPNVSPGMNTAGSAPGTKQKLFDMRDPLYYEDVGEERQLQYAVPHWVDCSFFQHSTGKYVKVDKFNAQCKMHEIQMMGIMEHDMAHISIPLLSEEDENSPSDTEDEVTFERYNSANIPISNLSSSLQKNMITTRPSDHPNRTVGPPKAQENYLSRSGPLTDQQSLVNLNENMDTQSENNNLIETVERIDYDEYDSHAFKRSQRPRFARQLTSGTNKSVGMPLSGTKSDSLAPQSSSYEMDTSTHQGENRMMTIGAVTGREMARANTVGALLDDSNVEYNKTWNHADNRKLASILSTSHQGSNRISFENGVRKEEGITRAMDMFRGSPKEDNLGRYGLPRSEFRRSAVALQMTTAGSSSFDKQPDEDELFTTSSSTVEPLPIKSGLHATGRPSERRKSYTRDSGHSPRASGLSASFSSMNRHSGNSDLAKTNMINATTTSNNRPSPARAWTSRKDQNKQSIAVNPCNPRGMRTIFTSHLRRWQHAVPKFDVSSGSAVHWRSLVTPACLPLTTDYFPPAEELENMYDHYMYTVSASEDVNLYQAGDRSMPEYKKTENLLNEMLSQRLAQGFQIIVEGAANMPVQKHMPIKGFIANTTDSPSGSGTVSGKDNKDLANNNGSNAALNAIKSSATGADDQINNPVAKSNVSYLSMGHQVHKLTFDSSGQNVEVRRYVRTVQYDTKKTEYKCAVWPKHISFYRPKTVIFNYPNLMYAWNYLDHLVAGYQEELTDNLRFWRSRFIVIPMETLPANHNIIGGTNDVLDDEEKRLALFDTWWQSLRKAKSLTPAERDEMQKRAKKEIGHEFGLRLTTMDPSAYIMSEAEKALKLNDARGGMSPTTSPSLTKESKSKAIADAMRDPIYGLKIYDRRWHFTVFRNAFVGSEFVDWLITTFPDIDTREDAEKFGNSLMDRKPPLFVSSSNRHGFLDGHYFYRLQGEFALTQTKAWYSKSSPLKINNGSEIQDSSSAEFDISRGSKSKLTFDMSRFIIIDADPMQRTDRRETAILHYDTLHNPQNCYHFQLNWLGCTAQLIQDLLHSWSRQAERCGLKLVEGSVEQAFEDSENENPFQTPVPIRLAVQPPPIHLLQSQVEVPDQFFEIALVRHLGFVLDVEADSKFDKAQQGGVEVKYSYIKTPYPYDQYIHRSGVAFVQIRPQGEGFYWVNNRLFTNHTTTLLTRVKREREFSATTGHQWNNSNAAATPAMTHPDTLLRSFQEFCDDAQRLNEFWETTTRNLIVKNGLGWVYENAGEVDTIADGADMEVADTLSTPNVLGKTTTNESTNSSNSYFLEINSAPKAPDAE
ncbi:vacuolar membrane-associated protein iml1 [Umbelopsis sp. WA50703]